MELYITFFFHTSGTVRFFRRNWEEFKNGFGNSGGEYYLGNELLHLLTTSEDYDYLVEAQSRDGDVRRKLIRKVRIESEEENYKIQYREEDIDNVFEIFLSSFPFYHIASSKFFLTQNLNSAFPNHSFIETW